MRQIPRDSFSVCTIGVCRLDVGRAEFREGTLWLLFVAAVAGCALWWNTWFMKAVADRLTVPWPRTMAVSQLSAALSRSVSDSQSCRQSQSQLSTATPEGTGAGLQTQRLGDAHTLLLCDYCTGSCGFLGPTLGPTVGPSHNSTT